MMKDKVWFTLLICALGIILLFPVSASQAAKDYAAEKFDVNLEIKPDGSLLVTETVVFRFEGGPFTFAFRDLSYNELDVIDRLQASMDGQVLPQGTEAGMVEIEAGQPLKLTWHFEATSDTTREFKLIYRVNGAIRKDTEDVLRWRAIPEEHDYLIESSKISLAYPAGIEPISVEVDAEGAVGGQLDDRFEFSTGRIDKNQSVVLTASFPSGSLVQQPPLWQEQQAIQRELKNKAFKVGLIAGLLISILAAIGLFVYARRIRLETSLPPVSQKMVSPPSNTPPALAAHLIGSRTAALGAIFDLASRGVLLIKEVEKSWYGSRRFIILRNEPDGFRDESLWPHELGLLESLFVSKKGTSESIPTGDLPARLGSNSPFHRGLENEMHINGWRDEERKRLSTRLVIWSILSLVGGIILTISGLVVIEWSEQVVAVINAGAIMAGVGAAMAIWGLIGLIVGGSTSTLSISGLEQAAAWRGFETYLKDTARGREQAIRPDTFEIYLPYAAGFGLSPQWARYFEKQGGVAVPAWFISIGSDASREDFAVLVIMMASIHSSYSSSASGSGVAGASGGGASGAG